MKKLFYENKDQLLEIFDKFSDSILPKKQADSALFSPYRKFKYQDELAKTTFDYDPQNPDSFIEEFSEFFENAINFDATGVMYNVHPNPNVYGQVASFYASMANPNFCMDLPSGKLLTIEKAVINYLTQLAGWDISSSGGVFTFGGKGTLLYALKVALDKVEPAAKRRGLSGNNYVISNDLGHPCHIEICNWLGIGEDNCIRLKTENAVINVDDFKRTFVEIIEKGGKLPLIILNGMTTNNHSFDDVEAIYKARNEIVEQYNLDYSPHIHVDSVLGWVYLVVSRYDFIKNPLGLTDEVLQIFKEKCSQAKAVNYADSFAADFHKTGYCSYISSVFLIKDKSSLFNIEGGYTESDDMVFSEYAPYDYSLESSRSPHGPVSAFATLKTLGAEGFVRILANHTEAYLYLKEAFHQQRDALVCNYNEVSNLLFLAFIPEQYDGIEINENTPQDIADHTKEFNTGFYSYLVEKSKRGKNDIFFSCSRSYKYYGKSYGCLKIYSFNSHLDKEAAKEIHKRINEVFEEYAASKGEHIEHKFFDYAEIKGIKHV